MGLLRSGPVDVLVSDIEMPDEDGYSLLERANQERNGAAPLPAIAVTAYARTSDRRRALAAGFRAHLAKPIEPSDLVTAVAAVARE